MSRPSLRSVLPFVLLAWAVVATATALTRPPPPPQPPPTCDAWEQAARWGIKRLAEQDVLFARNELVVVPEQLRAVGIFPGVPGPRGRAIFDLSSVADTPYALVLTYAEGGRLERIDVADAVATIRAVQQDARRAQSF